MTIPVGGASVSASTGAHSTAVTVTLPAANYYLTSAGGTDSLITALANQLSANVLGYPRSASATTAAIGLGTWTAGWLCEETSGNLAAVFGSPTMTASGTPTYSNAGPAAGTDKAVGFDSATDAFDGGNVHDIGLNDLCLAWVAKFDAAPSAYATVISKITSPPSGAGYHLFVSPDGVMRFEVVDGGGVKGIDVGTSGVHVGQWHAGIVVLDRGAGTIRIATRGLTSGTTVVSTTTAVSGSVTTVETFRFGQSDWANSANFKLSAVYVGTGAGAAVGMSAGLSTAVQNFGDAVLAFWTPSLSTTTGLVSIGNSFWPSSVQFTSTALRDVLGFAYDVDYPQTAAQMATALGYGTWTSGWLCNEASGNLAAAFGSPSLTPAGTPTYSNLGARGGSDKAVGFDAANESFGGGDVFDVTATDDLCLAWVGRFATTTATEVLFAKGDAGAARWTVYTNAGSLIFECISASGTVTASVSLSGLAGRHHIALVTLDRATAKFRIAVRDLTANTSTVSAETTAFAETMANADGFTVGGRAGAFGATQWQCSAFYIGTRSTGLSANISAALSNFATYMKSQTSTKQARGLWFPDCPLTIEGDPAVAPKVTDHRTTRGPTGIVLGLSGNSFYRHKGVAWTHIPRAQVWEAATTYANGSFETFANDCIFGLGHEWFTPSSKLQIYWDDAGTQRPVGYTFNSSVGVTGWNVLNLDSVEPSKAVAQWTGLWRIELGDVISSGAT